jgi:hypothetical protein
MPFWISSIEEQTVLRLASGERWKLKSAEKVELARSWDAESRAERNEAIQAIQAIIAAIRQTRSHNSFDKCEAYATVTAVYSPRWDLWAECLDRAVRPPQTFATPQRDAAQIANHTLAVLCRRNPALQTYAEQLQKAYTAPNNPTEPTEYTAHEPTYYPLDHTHADRLQTAYDVLRPKADSSQYTQLLAELTQAMAQMWHTNYTQCEHSVAKARMRLDFQRRRTQGGKDMQYWMPMSKIQVKQWERAMQDRCRPRFP